MDSDKEQSALNNYGFIYVIGCPEGYYKIGRCRYVDSRVKQLAIQLPFKIDLVHMWFVHNAPAEEREMHVKFHHRRANGEWFRLTAEDLDYIAKTQILYSDLRLALAYRAYFEQGDTGALAGVRELYKRLPNHVVPLESGLPEVEASVQ